MHILDLTLADPCSNLALDEALLDEAQQQGPTEELLRVWEFPEPVVVLGRSSRRSEEVHPWACKRDQVEVLRRSSGGAAIVAGPGCFMYSLVLSFTLRPQLQLVDQAHQFVLGRIAQSLQSLDIQVELAGISDLAWTNQKVSGNSLRSKRTHLLYHGTLLYDFPLPLVSEYLSTPPRQPAYRSQRDHASFLTNLPVSKEDLQAAVCASWQPANVRETWPRERMETLVETKYSQDSWNTCF